jgi:hypothetical protein
MALTGEWSWPSTVYVAYVLDEVPRERLGEFFELHERPARLGQFE